MPVLHLVAGKEFHGGLAASVYHIARLAASEFEHRIWVHRDCTAHPGDPAFVRNGWVVSPNRGIAIDLLGSIVEALRVARWSAAHGAVVLHAHSRVGILAGAIAHWLTGIPLIIHLHFLARRAWIYRALAKATHAQVIYNSRRTARHYSDTSPSATIIAPILDWPKAPPRKVPATPPRFLAAGAFVPGKHLETLILAFSMLRMRHAYGSLHLFGSSPTPPPTRHEMRIRRLAASQTGVVVHAWDTHWAAHLRAGDIFVHLGSPESFGIVILEAFAAGVRMVVLPDTFINDYPGDLAIAGIHHAAQPSPEPVAAAMERALRDSTPSSTLWQLRCSAARLHDVARLASEMSRIYASTLVAASSTHAT